MEFEVCLVSSIQVWISPHQENERVHWVCLICVYWHTWMETHNLISRRLCMSLLCVCVCVDGKDNRGTSTGSLSVQPRPDQLCRHPATRQSERGGAAAVDVSGSQLDTPTVSSSYRIRQCNMKHILSRIIILFYFILSVFSWDKSLYFSLGNKQKNILRCDWGVFVLPYWIHYLPINQGDRCLWSNLIHIKYWLLIHLSYYGDLSQLLSCMKA